MRKLLILIFLFSCSQIMAQEKLMPVIPGEKDSAQIELERQILYRQMLSQPLQRSSVLSELKLPEFSLNTQVPVRYHFNSAEFIKPGIFFPPYIQPFGFMPSPFLREEMVFSSAVYKLNNKFNLGGYSFGANSVFSAPLPNQRMNNFDTRGATMFLQYKVSKNIKIETRISVTQGNNPGF